MKKIIVADDNQTFLMHLGLAVRNLDFKVMPAEDGLEVLRLLKLSGADIVVLDINMKMMDGFTVLRHMKADRKTSHIPVIMLSSDSRSETVERCRKLGCFEFLAKPVDIDALRNVFERCVNLPKSTIDRI